MPTTLSLKKINLQKKVLILFLSLLIFQSLNAQIVTLLNEDFSSNSFSTNGWTFPNSQGNWMVGSSNTPSGASAPNAFFNWAVSASNYSVALLSNTINATAINGPVTLDYLLLFNPYSTATLEQFKVEFKDVGSSTWSLIANYTNSPTAIQNWSVTNVPLSGMSGQNFQIRFVAYGVSSFNITRWSLDNVVVKGTTCVSALPSLTVTGTTTICAGTSATLTAYGGGASYTWSPAGGNASVAIVSPTVNTIYAIISNLTGCNTPPVSAISNITVLTNTTPLSVSGTSSVVCSQNSLTLTATGASSYTWNSGSLTTSIVVSPSVSTVYSVSSSNTLGCIVTKTIGINVNPNPVLGAFATNSAICSGGSNNLIASGAVTYTWNTGSNFAIITVSPLVTTIYSVAGTDNQGCAGTATVNVLVNSATVNVVGSSTAICTGNTATLTASGASSYTWNNNSTASNLVVTPSQNSIYSVTATNSFGCVTTKTIGLNVNPNPTVNIASSHTAICVGSSAQLTANGASTYTWSNLLSGNSITVSPTSSTNYSVVGTSSQGCTGSNNSSSLTLLVNPVPVVTAISSTTTVCSGQALTFTASGASTYSWNFGATGSIATVYASQNAVYSVTGTSSLQCSSSSAINLTVIASPTINITSSSNSICVGSTVTLLANGAQTYTWNNGSQVNVIYDSPNSTTSYTVKGTGVNGCTDSKNIQIVVDQYPLTSAFSSDSLVCAGEPVSLSAIGALSYVWSTSQTGPSIVVFPNTQTTYTVTGSNNGCSTTTTITQLVEECTGVSKYEMSSDLFSLYPNPSTGIFTIESAEKNTPLIFVCYNGQGAEIISKTLIDNSQMIDLRNQPNGLYYIKVSNGQTSKLFNVIKN